MALYIVVGFDNRWEEVVLALGQMAHFENRKRSRILVLTADPGRDAKIFKARFPRFTIDNCVQVFWNDVNFCAFTDEGSSTFAGAKKLTNAHSGKKARVPEAMHVRKTLCPWDQLDQNKDETERQKDIDQTWYVLLAFKAMSESNRRGT